MVSTVYKPVAHNAAFKKKILAKPGVKKAYEALEEEYVALHANHRLPIERKAEA